MHDLVLSNSHTMNTLGYAYTSFFPNLWHILTKACIIILVLRLS